MTQKIACLYDDAVTRSDPGIFVCSTDMIFFLPESEKVTIRNSQVSVLSSLSDYETAQKNGIYELDEHKVVI
jgi:hypothetical protein